MAEALLARGERVVGVDNLNAYYDVRLKQARLARLEGKPGFAFHRADVVGSGGDPWIWSPEHATIDADRASGRAGRGAAFAGRSLCLCAVERDGASGDAGGRAAAAAAAAPGLCQLVVGLWRQPALPFREADRVDTPLSVYAATKRADELMSHAYAHLHGLPQTGLRFFTVYGPWGRPDMAYYSFARAIVAGEPITLYDGGTLRRDFTYIDDIVAGVVGLPGPAA